MLIGSSRCLLSLCFLVLAGRANPTFFPGKGGKSATAAASRSANPKK